MGERLGEAEDLTGEKKGELWRTETWSWQGAAGISSREMLDTSQVTC